MRWQRSVGKQCVTKGARRRKCFRICL